DRQAVAGVDREAELGAEAGGRRQGAQWPGVFRMMRVGACVQLDGDGAELARRLDGALLGIDEKARSDPGRVHPRDALANARRLARQIEAAFGGDFLATL